MAITFEQFQQAVALSEGIDVKLANAGRYEASMNDYINGGTLSGELQEVLRPWLSGQLPALLADYRASIQADVDALRAIVSNFP